MKILFIENHLNVRGTTLALYDYAHFNETILGNQSIIATRPYSMINSEDVSPAIYEKFEKRFPVFYFTSPNQIQSIIDAEKPDWVYVQKGGNRDGYDYFKNVKSIIHCIGPPSDPHGDLYCAASSWLNVRANTDYPILPYMIYVPETEEDMRLSLNIPENATVFGRIGGLTAFDLPAAQQAVDIVSRDYPEIYFVFVHTKPFCSPRPNIIHLSTITDRIEKVKFINTCDAMIYGREMGESFGVAIGEFSIKNKPIVCTDVDRHGRPMIDLMHKKILGDNALWYRNKDECVKQLVTFNRDEAKLKDWNMYKQYSPENVMKIFKQLISPISVGLYVIHNPQNTEREQAYGTVVKCLDLTPNMIWFKGANDLTEDDQKRFSSGLRNAEKSLILNHEHALQLFQNSEHNYAFILEDDTYVINEKVLRNLKDVLIKQKPEFDSVYVGPGCFTDGYNIPLKEGQFVFVPHPGSRCTELILYSRKGCETTLQGLKDLGVIEKPLDHILPTKKTQDYKNYHLHPYPVIQGTGTGMFKSTIR